MIRIVLVLLISLFAFIEVNNARVSFEGHSKECILNSAAPNLNVESEAIDPLQSIKVARDHIVFSDFEWNWKEKEFQSHFHYTRCWDELKSLPLLTVSFLI